MIPLLLASLLCQDPAPVPARRPTQDVVRLKNGDRLEGRVLTQVDGYVEIQVEDGAVVGIGAALVAGIDRAPPAPADAGAAAPPPALPPRNEWFVLHDASGQAVGWLHSAVVPRRDGTVQASEEYEFVQGRRRYQITVLCTADAALQPLSCYFRERQTEPVLGIALLPGAEAQGQADRVVDERIVEAECRGDHLHVTRLDRHGRRERDHEWPRGTTFPLLAQAVLRARLAGPGPRPLFDPATEEFVTWEVAPARPRTVTLDQQRLAVTELASRGASGRNAEWLAEDGRLLRRELAGPALVATASSRSGAQALVGGPAGPGAVCRDAGGALGLWLPNPAWAAAEEVPAGQLVLHCAAHGARVLLAQLDHLEAAVTLASAADAVANWYHLLQPELRLTGRSPTQVRDRRGVRLEFAGGSGAAARRAMLDVVPVGERFAVLVCEAPAAAWDELAEDFAFVQRSLELGAATAAIRRPPAAAAAPAAAPQRAARPAAAPLVRVPTDG